MNKSNIMKAAHKLAKTFSGDYRACLSMALREVYKAIKSIVAKQQYEVAVAKVNAQFGGVVAETGFQINLTRNTYPVKEELKELGFKFNPKSRNWTFWNVDNSIDIKPIVFKLASLVA